MILVMKQMLILLVFQKQEEQARGKKQSKTVGVISELES